jgi:hypothetical protein
MSWMRKQGLGLVFGLAVSGFVCSAVSAEEVAPAPLPTPKADTVPSDVSTAPAVAVAPAAPAPDNKPVLTEEKLIQALGAPQEKETGDNDSRVIRRRETQGFEVKDPNTPAPAPAKAAEPAVVKAEPAPEPKHNHDEKKKDSDVVRVSAPATPAPAAKPAEACDAKGKECKTCPPACKMPCCAAKPGAAPVVAAAPGSGLAPISVTCWEPDSSWKSKMESLKAKEGMEQQDKIRRLIVRLASPGWAEAKEDLIKIGRPAVPHLIAAMSVPADTAEPYKYAVFNTQGPRKWVRQRPMSEAAYDVLDTLIRNHSNYTGAVPAFSQADWQAFWSGNSGSIALGFENK